MQDITEKIIERIRKDREYEDTDPYDAWRDKQMELEAVKAEFEDAAKYATIMVKKPYTKEWGNELK
jgi:hypothetical protein